MAEISLEEHIGSLQLDDTMKEFFVNLCPYPLLDPKLSNMKAVFARVTNDSFGLMDASTRKGYEKSVKDGTLKLATVDAVVELIKDLQVKMEHNMDYMADYLPRYCITCLRPDNLFNNTDKNCQCYVAKFRYQLGTPVWTRNTDKNLEQRFMMSMTNDILEHHDLMDKNKDDMLKLDSVLTIEQWAEYYEYLQKNKFRKSAVQTVKDTIFEQHAKENLDRMFYVLYFANKTDRIMDYLAYVISGSRAECIYMVESGKYGKLTENQQLAVDNIMKEKEAYEKLMMHPAWNYKMFQLNADKAILSPEVLLVLSRYMPVIKNIRDRHQIRIRQGTYIVENFGTLCRHEDLIEKVKHEGSTREQIKPKYLTGCAYCYTTDATKRCSECHITVYCSEDCSQRDWGFHKAFIHQKKEKKQYAHGHAPKPYTSYTQPDHMSLGQQTARQKLMRLARQSEINKVCQEDLKRKGTTSLNQYYASACRDFLKADGKRYDFGGTTTTTTQSTAEKEKSTTGKKKKAPKKSAHEKRKRRTGGTK